MKIMNAKRANKIKYYLTLAGLVGTLGAVNPIVANAEEEVLFTSTDENVTYDEIDTITVTENTDGTITSEVVDNEKSHTEEVVNTTVEGVTPTEDTRTDDIVNDNTNSNTESAPAVDNTKEDEFEKEMEKDPHLGETIDSEDELVKKGYTPPEKPEEPEKPGEPEKPVEPEKPTQPTQPVQPVQPKPVEVNQPVPKTSDTLFRYAGLGLAIAGLEEGLRRVVASRKKYGKKENRRAL